jgi:transmembrane sensor
MNERFEHAQRLGRRIDAEWQREDVEAQLARLHARQRTRARRRALAAPLAAAAITAAVFAAISARRETTPPAVPALRDVAVDRPAHAVATAPVVTPAPRTEGPALASGVLSLGDGSIVTPLGKDSRLLARRVSESDVVVALTGGGARFDVPDREARRFRADLGALALETHGAAFRVAITRRQIEVVAERGEISARWGRERHVVTAGETRTFPVAAHDDVAPVDHDEPVPAPEPPSTWRDDAGRGDYAAAWDALALAPAPVSMEDLLLAGDVARLSGHREAAVASLSRAVALHAEDPRAPLAAFTLGRVHLEDLGAPRDAALAFARARELAPGGPLAEDALAREVEAWSRAGETETARARALTYTRQYPQGHRVHAVRRFGGLESP